MKSRTVGSDPITETLKQIESSQRVIANLVASTVAKVQQKQKGYDAHFTLAQIKGALFNAEFAIGQIKDSIR